MAGAAGRRPADRCRRALGELGTLEVAKDRFIGIASLTPGTDQHGYRAAQGDRDRRQATGRSGRDPFCNVDINV